MRVSGAEGGFPDEVSDRRERKELVQCARPLRKALGWERNRGEQQAADHDDLRHQGCGGERQPESDGVADADGRELDAEHYGDGDRVDMDVEPESEGRGEHADGDARQSGEVPDDRVCEENRRAGNRERSLVVEQAFLLRGRVASARPDRSDGRERRAESS